MPGRNRPSWQLAVTRRCLEEDLRVDPSGSWQDYVDRYPILAAFRDRRGALPEGEEVIQQVRRVLPVPPVFSLHSGDDRAGTWFDEEDNVVWLLGVGRNHDYDHLEDLARRQRLLPTLEDYDQLEAQVPSPAEFDELAVEARRLRQKAMAVQGRIVHGKLSDWLRVRACYELGEPPVLTVAINLELDERAIVPPSWLYLAAQAFFPEATYPEDFVPFSHRIDGEDVEANEQGLAYFVDPDV
jgi:hypothetical protein